MAGLDIPDLGPLIVTLTVLAIFGLLSCIGLAIWAIIWACQHIAIV